MDVNHKTEKPKACLHDACPDCKGTGRKANGMTCVHFMYCGCEKCSKKSAKNLNITF